MRISKYDPRTQGHMSLSHGEVNDSAIESLKEFEALEALSLCCGVLTQSGFAALGGLRKLSSLDIDGTPLSDSDLVQVSRLGGLVKLRLFRSPFVTDDGMPHFEKLERLQTLFLCDTKVSDRGLPVVARLKGLTHLSLVKTAVTDSGLDALEGLVSLQFLDLGRTRVTDLGVKTLSGFPFLGDLLLAGTTVTDEGLAHLAEARSLTRLDLHGLPITDGGLASLMALSGLKFLNLQNTQVSDAGVAQFQGAVPDCAIYRGPC